MACYVVKVYNSLSFHFAWVVQVCVAHKLHGLVFVDMLCSCKKKNHIASFLQCISLTSPPKKKKKKNLCPHFHLSLNHEGRWGTTDDFTTSFFQFSLFFIALWNLANSRPVHSLMLSFTSSSVCLVFFPFLAMPCKMVLARPDEWVTCSYHSSLHLCAMVRSSLLKLV